MSKKNKITRVSLDGDENAVFYICLKERQSEVSIKEGKSKRLWDMVHNIDHPELMDGFDGVDLVFDYNGNGKLVGIEILA